MFDLALYGIEENIGLHVVLSNSLWWASAILALIAYRNRRLWDVGDMPWAFLFLTFLCFGIRELGHFSTSIYIASIRYLFGIWSAIFMASAFMTLCMRICHRKKCSGIRSYTPFAMALIFGVILLYLFFSDKEISNIRKIMSFIETLAWLSAGSIIIYATYMLGTSVTGGFKRIFMFFQFSGFAAFTWKFLGLIVIIGSPIPYSVREIVETIFGIFAIISIYLLTKMLRNLKKHMHGK